MMAAVLGKSLRFTGGEILRCATWAAATKAATMGYEQGTVVVQAITPSLPDPTFSDLLDVLMVACLVVVLLVGLVVLILSVHLMRQITTGQKPPTKKNGGQSKSPAPATATGTSKTKSPTPSKRSSGSKSASRTHQEAVRLAAATQQPGRADRLLGEEPVSVS